VGQDLLVDGKRFSSDLCSEGLVLAVWRDFVFWR
jgi:hypothetical protein